MSAPRWTIAAGLLMCVDEHGNEVDYVSKRSTDPVAYDLLVQCVQNAEQYARLMDSSVSQSEAELRLHIARQEWRNRP